MSLLEIKNLNMGFNFEAGYFPVLFDVSLSVEKQKTLALVGESGSGKTMTAMSVLRLLPKNSVITSGDIIFNGQNLLKLKQNDMTKIRGKEIALIPQDPMCSLNPLYTIGNQLLEVINLHQNIKGKEAFELAVESLEKVRIPNARKRMDSYAHELSGGMKQRVIIAMALATNAKLIIADEPTTALDVTVQAQIMKLLNEIKTNYETSIILITHDLGLVAENADDTAVMYCGRIVEYSDTASIFNNPIHPYTKALLKALPDVNKNKLEAIKGQPPSIFDKISGCKFNPRCNFKQDLCLKEVPTLENYAKDKMVACFYPNEKDFS